MIVGGDPSLQLGTKWNHLWDGNVAIETYRWRRRQPRIISQRVLQVGKKKGDVPEAGESLARWRNRSEVSNAGVQWARRRGVWRGRGIWGRWGQVMLGPSQVVGTVGFIHECVMLFAPHTGWPGRYSCRMKDLVESHTTCGQQNHDSLRSSLSRTRLLHPNKASSCGS